MNRKVINALANISGWDGSRIEDLLHAAQNALSVLKGSGLFSEDEVHGLVACEIAGLSLFPPPWEPKVDRALALDSAGGMLIASGDGVYHVERIATERWAEMMAEGEKQKAAYCRAFRVYGGESAER